MTPLKILVAEDFSAFREFVCAQLHRRTDVHVVAVDDGLAAVQAAADLQPELVLLDIGLPTMNGLEAARHIRAQSPASKVVFLTQESAPEFVEAALDLGVDGYIIKTRAHDYMLPVVETMLAGRAGATNARAPRAPARMAGIGIMPTASRTIRRCWPAPNGSCLPPWPRRTPPSSP